MIRVLFVCLGNICRSASAEGVMKTMVAQAGLSDQIECDSAGTADFHEGEGADPRMRLHAIRRSYQLDSVARRIVPEVDFEKFDLIIAMDNNNFRDLNRLAPNSMLAKKICKMTDFGSPDYDQVPDPYYGGEDGFELVLDILEESCSGLLNRLMNEWIVEKGER
ncbi:MAG: low molecular weight protein-tyrosine-phosphatase [Mangrovibacterium sp.]